MAENDDDPFAGIFGLTANDVAEIESQADEPVNAPATAQRRGRWFVFDLETIPDETRFPKPERPDKPVRESGTVDLDELQGQTVAGVTRRLSALSEDQLRHLLQMEQDAKKPRSGVVAAVEKELQIFDTETQWQQDVEQWRRLSFDPFRLRVVALGIETSSGERTTMIAKTIDEERDLLQAFWDHAAIYDQRVGYNINAFDDLVIVARSMILGVDASRLLEIGKFSRGQSIDLMRMIFPDRPMKLKELCQCLGIVPDAGYEMSGDKVLDLVEAGDWDGVAAYVASDAKIEAELFRLASDYIKH
jgi:hypothetical protein